MATTENANSNIIASYIKKGIRIGGITGTLEILDTSDANATPEDIVKGKTAYVNGVKITGTYIEKGTLGKVTGNETENSYVNDKYGNQVVVPAGFKIVNPEDDVTKGIIIEDVSAPGKTSYTKGSQFVWIPVGDVITDNNGTKTKVELGRYSFSSDGTPSAYSGVFTEDTAQSHNSLYKNVIAKNIDDFKTKATTSGGYYIGRYEAGDALAISSARTGVENVSNPNNPVACKSGIYPYNYVDQSDASSLAKNMYSSSNFESDLCNSYAWDTAIVFIQKFSGDANYSMQLGKNTKNALLKCGESILNTVDVGDKSQDLRCNIYDMAGNTYEWTTETRPYNANPCVFRGGRYASTNSCSSIRYDTSEAGSGNGGSFRITLYL